MKQSFSQTIQLIRSDLAFRCEYEHKTMTFLQLLSFLTNHSVLSQMVYRWQIFFFSQHLVLLASLLKGINSFIFTVNIDHRTQIGEGLLILHANYIFIGRYVTLGKRCILVQQNTLGPAFTLESEGVFSDRGPVIGNNVLLGVGCAIFGDIHIGDDSRVAVNTAVDKSFPAKSLLVGVPAKNMALT